MYHLTILTPDKKIFEGEVYSLNAPGTIGYLEILTDHAAIITSLQPGKLTVQDAQGEKKIYAVSGGALEVVKNQAIILGDAIEDAAKIDLSRAKAAYDQAQKILDSETEISDFQIHKANVALLRAENRIKVYQDYHNQK